MPTPPDPPSVNIETVDYQARAAAEKRPCGHQSCIEEFPGMPSRWCSNCLIAALLKRLKPDPPSSPEQKAIDKAIETLLIEDLTPLPLIEALRQAINAKAHADAETIAQLRAELDQSRAETEGADGLTVKKNAEIEQLWQLHLKTKRQLEAAEAEIRSLRASLDNQEPTP